MATRKIILDGDSTGLRAAASAATTALKAELEAQKKAMADAKAAVKALSKDATDVERNAAREAVGAAKTALDAKRKAYAEASAAAKAAAAAAKVAAQEEVKSQRDIVAALRATAKERNVASRTRDAAWAQSGKKASPGGAEAGGGGIGRDVADLKIMAFVRGLSRGIQMLTAFSDALERRQNELLNKTLSANELAGKRSEALRLAGVSMGEADALGKTIGATAGNLSSSDISAALEQAATEGSGKLKGQQVLDVLKVSGSGSAGSALTAASYGMSAKDSVALAERYRLQTRGGSLSREQGQAISGLMSGGQLKGAEGVADYLAAAQESGQGLKGVDGRAPFMGTDPSFYESYAQLRGRRSTRQAGASILERERNSAQGTEEAALASQDQAAATGQQAKERARAERILITSREGGAGALAGQAVRDILGQQDIFTEQSEASRAIFDRTKKFQVEAVVNQPAER